MPRALAILKYVPAVVCGLLVVAWVVSAWIRQFGVVWFEFNRPFEDRLVAQLTTYVDGGTAVFYICDNRGEPKPMPFAYPFQRFEFISNNPAGRLDLLGNGLLGTTYLAIPIALIICALLPLAVGCLTRFRFPLWSYFVWIALLAAELAYYLR